jgi:type IV secretory pathway VirD2 relaxase
MVENWVIQSIIAILLGIVAYLLRQKDVEQGRSIALLFKKHDEDADRLNKFELRIAQEHYIKPELDARFDKLETAFRHGFETLGNKFDKLSEALINERHNHSNRQE